MGYILPCFISLESLSGSVYAASILALVIMVQGSRFLIYFIIKENSEISYFLSAFLGYDSTLTLL